MKQITQMPLIDIINEFFQIINLNECKKRSHFVTKLSHFCTAPTITNLNNLIMSANSFNDEFGKNRKDELSALTSAHYIRDNFDNVYSILANPIMTKSAANDGEVISWCDDTLVVENSNDNRCQTRTLTGSPEHSRFYFGFEDTPHFVIAVRNDSPNFSNYELYKRPRPSDTSTRLKEILKSHNIA